MSSAGVDVGAGVSVVKCNVLVCELWSVSISMTRSYDFGQVLLCHLGF